MNITSPVFENDRPIPKRYSCEGIGVNPPLTISDPPDNAESLALIVHDPDAPNGDFIHWLLWNIDPSVDLIAEGSAPFGSVEGTNGAGELGWTAPCPPYGMHHYEFDLYALDTKLDMPEKGSKIEFFQALEGHVLQKVTLVGLYEKENS